MTCTSHTSLFYEGSVSKHVANRKRKEQNGTVEELCEINWDKLDTWGREFVANNPGSHYHIETSGMRFERMFVGVAAAAEMALKTGINFSGVDGTFFKNSVFKGKLVLLQLTTRDGNNQIMPLAWCICKKENSDNYHYFAEHCEKVKYLHHFTGQSVCFSDKSWQFQLLKITDS